MTTASSQRDDGLRATHRLGVDLLLDVDLL